MNIYFSFIYALYILSLSFIPCTDNDTHQYEQGIVIVLDSHSNHHHSNDEHVDLCSPFCSCSCCGVLTIKAKEHTFSFSYKSSKWFKKIITYQPANSEAVLNAIWQPPKFIS